MVSNQWTIQFCHGLAYSFERSSWEILGPLLYLHFISNQISLDGYIYGNNPLKFEEMNTF